MVGEDSARREIPSALLAGRLEGIHLPDLLWALCQRRHTGVLRILREGIEKALYLADGRIVFAASADPDDRLGELFLRRGWIDLDQLQEALSLLHTGKRLGTLLVEAGSLTSDQLVKGVLTQVEGIVLDLFSWEEGEYRFEEGPLPTDEVITLTMRTGELVLRGMRRVRSFGRMRKSVGGLHQVYGLAPGHRDILEGLSLSAGEEMIVERLERGEVELETLCRDVYLSNFETYQTVWGLKVIGVLEERERPRAAASDASFEGSLSRVEFAELLVRLGRAGDTGVLYVTRGDQERTFHVSGGRCTFATSNDPDDGLVAFLLRRGVISLSDREETAKRLLSNKRVGTIMRELGVIDESDLREMVREQLSEIVYDTFRWTDADYAFVPGALPSVEEITLEEDLDGLVAEGIRRVQSWSRVWRGCGGFQVSLELKPTYLTVLDAMKAGPEEWQVITALRTPRTPREICRSSDVADFRVCQILWALHVLGAVGPAERSELAEAGSEREEVAVADRPRSSKELEPPEASGVPEVEEASVADPARPSADHEPAEAAGGGPEVEEDLDEPSPGPAGEPVTATADPSPATGNERGPDEPAETVAAAEPGVSDGEAARPGQGSEPRFEVSEPGDLEHGESTAPEGDRGGEATSWEARSTPSGEREEAVSEGSTDQTQWIPREALDAALDADAGETERGARLGESDATQMIPREVLDAANVRRVDLPAPPEVTAPRAGDVSPDATQAIPREAIDGALGGNGRGGDPVETVAPDRSPAATDPAAARSAREGAVAEPAEAIDGLDRHIERFNAAQRVVYRAVRAEVGAGASNFIRSCCTQLAQESRDPTVGVGLRADGSWNVEQLMQSMRELALDDPVGELQRLIEIELVRVGEFLGEPRASELRRQLERMEGAGVG